MFTLTLNDKDIQLCPFPLSSRDQVPLKPKSVQLFIPFNGKAALFASIINLLQLSLIVDPLTKMRNVARDVAVVVDGAVLHQSINNNCNVPRNIPHLGE